MAITIVLPGGEYQFQSQAVLQAWQNDPSSVISQNIGGVNVVSLPETTASSDTATAQPDAPNFNPSLARDELTKAQEAAIASYKSAESRTQTDLRQNMPKASNSDDGRPDPVIITGKNYDGAGAGRGAGYTSQPTQTTEIPKPRSNPLHEYATYTYGITLYILSSQDFNNLQQANADQLNAWKPTYSLISSGGAHAGQERHPAFKDDFYFDSFKMTTIVGMNAMTRGTNAIQLSFTVIEPYGLTLLDRTIEAAKSVGSDNYLSQPYLLEIDFFGSKDLGDMETPIPQLRKRIPVQIIEMKIKAGTKGSEYAITCIPYNHTAFNENAVSTPANFEVTASTVKDFFSNAAASTLEAQKKQKDDARNAAILARGVVNDDEGNRLPGVGAVGIGGDEKALAAAEQIINAAYKVESYTGAVNAWNQKLVDNTHYKFSNEIEFNIDPAFADSPIVDPNKTSPSRSAYSYTGTADKKASNQGNDPTISDKTPATDFNKNKMTFNINAGTSIIDVINNVMRNSEYIKRQVIDPSAGETTFAKDKTVDYFKIIPQIVLKNFDPLRNTFATKTVYHVKKYSYFNSKHPNLPYGTPDGPVKEYNYIYTGKNIDIIDFSIDFNTAFYTTKVVDRDNKEATNSAPESNSETKPDQGKRPTGSGKNSIAQNQSKPVAAQANTSTSMADTAKAALVANAMDSIYSSSRGDMIQVKLKILGDPHFIKQDDLYTNPGMRNYNDKPVMLNTGTIAMDSKEIFCKLNFKTPVDMDDKTGLLRLDGKYTISKFTGLYKIIQVETELARGQFVQTLDCIRIFDKPESESESSDSRKEQKDDAVAKQSTSSESRNLKISGITTVTPPEPSNPQSIFNKVKTEGEAFVKRAVATTEETVDSAIVTARNLKNKLSKDLFDTKPVDIGTQKTADANSPEPQNPQE